mgnify:CR=1 FL=1
MSESLTEFPSTLFHTVNLPSMMSSRCLECFMDFLPASCGGSSAHVCFDFPGDGTSPFGDDYKK